MAPCRVPEAVKSMPATSGRPRFVSTKEAADYVPYSADYISRLAREGKVAAERTQKGWQVSLEALKLFMLEQQAEQRARHAELREARLREYAKKETERSDRVRLAVAAEWVPASLLAATTALCLVVVGALGSVVVREDLHMAQLWSGVESVAEIIEDVVPARATPVAQSGEVPAAQVLIVDGVLQVGEGGALQDAISEPATASVVSETSAVLTPVFAEDWSTAYELTITPVVTTTTP